MSLLCEELLPINMRDSGWGVQEKQTSMKLWNWVNILNMSATSDMFPLKHNNNYEREQRKKEEECIILEKTNQDWSKCTWG